MSSMATSAVPVRTAILNELRAKAAPYSSIDLLKTLTGQGYSDSDVRQTLSELIREGSIELTTQRLLKSVAEDAA